MGGCATKPKGLTSEADSIPVPAPAPVKVDSVPAAEPKNDGETKVVGAVKIIEEAAAEVEGHNEEEVKVDDGDDDKVDDQANKRRSLSLLFKENEEGKESREIEKTIETEAITPEPVNQEELKSDNASEVSNTKLPETKKAEIQVEEIPTPVVAIAPEIVETEKPTIDEPVTETQKPVNPVEETPISAPIIAPETVVTEKPIEAAPVAETTCPENSGEKKTEEEKGCAVEDVKVKEEDSNIDIRQEGSVLPVSSSEKVTGEVAETK